MYQKFFLQDISIYKLKNIIKKTIDINLICLGYICNIK